jgi:hypothetical protein
VLNKVVFTLTRFFILPLLHSSIVAPPTLHRYPYNTITFSTSLLSRTHPSFTYTHSLNMFSTAFVTIALLLASGAEAIKVTSPSETTVQSAGSALQLTWDSVSTDPTSFAVVLVNQVSFSSLR